MKEYIIRNSDKGPLGDITRKLQEILSEAKDYEGKKVIRFEKGEYHFYSDFCESETLYASNTDSDRFPEKKTAINIDRQKDLTIDGSGSMFIMHGKMIAVKVSFSENISLKNFSWDFPCAGTLEMALINKGIFYADYRIPKESQWEVKKGKLHWFEKSPFDGREYWHNIGQEESYCVVVYDKLKKNLCRYGMNEAPFSFAYKTEKLSDSTVRVHYLKPLKKHFHKDAIFEICTSKKRDCVGAFFLESKNVSAENVGVHYMHGFGWLVQMCENVSYRSCNFTPRKGSDRNNASFADFIHVSGAKGKVHIENCRFSNAHDDPINIHGTYTVVKERLDDRSLLLEYAHHQQNGFVQYHEGDKVVFYLRKNLRAFEEEREFTVSKVINPLEDGNNVKQMKVTFSEKLPDEICEKDKYAVENVTYTPEVYIGNCRFELIPTRGILCTTRGKALIENNVFDGMTMASIYLSDDCNDWYESGAIHSMTIRNNVFYVRKAPNFKGVKSAIFIEPIICREDKQADCVHRNITVDSNIFYLEHDNAVNGKLTENLHIRNNKIYTLLSENSDKNIRAFNLKSCKNLLLENNTADENIVLDV